jgi:hypothetical protein
MAVSMLQLLFHRKRGKIKRELHNAFLNLACFVQAPVGRIFFTGEHTSERFSGYVHGGYLAGENT